MRSYVNKKKERIVVDQDHLDTALRIKKELQNASPSRRCPWNLFVKLMEGEGFDDAETSEAYRCMLKDYQKGLGELPSAKTHAEMVSQGKLESIKELVGELSYEKRENQAFLKEINKGKRELIDFAIVTEEIGNAFRTYDYSLHQITPADPLISGGKKMIVSLSDLHIGALVDTEVNTYNFNIALSRLSQYAARIIQEAHANQITDLYVMNLGDVIEHATMRYSQGFTAEFSFSEQLVRATDLLIKFLTFLAQEGFHITYAGIAGNHDRITDKDRNIDGDHAVKAINYGIESFIKNSGINNLHYDQAKDYKHSFTINGVNVLALHGDLDSKNDPNLMFKHSSLDGTDYNLVLMGHYHTVEIREIGIGRLFCMCGSTKGADEYSLNKLRKASAPSQSYFIIDEDGRVDARWIVLK